jgi:hypothetical protein
VSELEIAFLDRKYLKGQKRVFDLPAITTQVASSPRDEDLGVLGHASLLGSALAEGEKKSRHHERPKETGADVCERLGVAGCV